MCCGCARVGTRYGRSCRGCPARGQAVATPGVDAERVGARSLDRRSRGGCDAPQGSSVTCRCQRASPLALSVLQCSCFCIFLLGIVHDALDNHPSFATCVASNAWMERFLRSKLTTASRLHRSFPRLGPDLPDMPGCTLVNLRDALNNDVFSRLRKGVQMDQWISGSWGK